MKTIINSILMLLVLTILTGIIYPLAMTGLGIFLFPEKANGSLYKIQNTIIGSELIGQKFTSPKYFWGRPSAVDYNPMPSGASNYGPTSKVLLDSVNARTRFIQKTTNINNTVEIPKELLFASASGVDPDISPEAARFQINRIAIERNFTSEQKKKLAQLVENSIEQPQFGFLGEPRVNVLKLNINLDKIK